MVTSESGRQTRAAWVCVVAARTSALLALILSPLVAYEPAVPAAGVTARSTPPADFYVGPGGNDTNPGTQALPLRTIQAGIDKARPGEVVMIMAGTYDEHLSFPRSGADGSPITLTGEVDGSGNPLAIVDNTIPVGATWEPAPEIGAGVYMKAGFAPKLMLWNGDQILGINAAHMAGDSDQYCDRGFNILNYPADKVWHPGGTAGCSTPFWDDVEVIYGVLGNATYIRFRDGDSPDTCDLRAVEGSTACLTLDDNDYITIEHLRFQGAITSVVFKNSNHNIFRHNVVRHGNQRMTFSGSSGNLIEHNDFSLGYGSYGCFGEWGSKSTGVFARRYATYALGKWLAGDGSSLDRGVMLGGRNDFSHNRVHRGDIGIYGGSHSDIHDNEISEFSSVGFYLGPSVESIYIHNNDIYHCNGSIRLGSIGAAEDTNRSGFIYNNRAYNDSGAGQFLIFNVQGANFAKPPDFWIYHNSYAGGAAWGQALAGPCGRMKVINNIMSGKYLMAGATATDDTTPMVWAAFDHSFLGGSYATNCHRFYKWAAVDSHNIWPADTVNGSIRHQVWPLGSEPDWFVPDTSPAYQSGLDLSDSFELRGIRYGPLPGMTRGYFAGARPNLGAIRDTGQMKMPESDPRRGSVTQMPELAFAPNPATGRQVIARCSIPTGKVARLTLRDVVGRTVKSIALCRSGVTPLALLGLTPGVYIAALDAGGPPVSGKLIIAAH